MIIVAKLTKIEVPRLYQHFIMVKGGLNIVKLM